jgi:hypothetical protein
VIVPEFYEGVAERSILQTGDVSVCARCRAGGDIALPVAGYRLRPPDGWMSPSGWNSAAKANNVVRSAVAGIWLRPPGGGRFSVD